MRFIDQDLDEGSKLKAGLLPSKNKKGLQDEDLFTVLI